MVSPFVINVYESLICSKCEKMYLKIRESLFERVKYAEDNRKPKNAQDLEDFSKNNWQFSLSQTRHF